MSYLLLWPHIRPWRLRVSEPMLNSIPDAAEVAAKLAEALTGQPGPSAISLVQFGDAECRIECHRKFTRPPWQPERRIRMSEVFHEPIVPRGGVFAAAALVLFALAAVTTVRLTGVGGTHMVLPAAIESRDLQFEDGKNGAVLVFDAQRPSVGGYAGARQQRLHSCRVARARARAKARRYRSAAAVPV